MNSGRFSIVHWPRIGFGVFGAWSLFAQVLICASADFETLHTLGVIPALCALIYFLWKPKSEGGSTLPTGQIVREQNDASGGRLGSTTNSHRGRAATCFWLLSPVLIAGCFSLRWEWIGWAAAVLYLLTWCFRNSIAQSSSASSRPKVSAKEIAALVAIGGLAVLLTLGSHRPNTDDAYFVSQIAATLDFPNLPLYGFDSLYRNDQPLSEQYLHFIQTYEFLVASAASATGLPHHTLYYVVFPSISALAAVLANWVLMRRFLKPIPALIGVLAVVALLALWGDGYAYGNYAFRRLFQGKAVLATVGVPILVHSCLVFRDRPTLRNGVLLSLHQCACVGLATNGLVIVPFACALAWFPTANLSRRFAASTAFAVVTMIPILVLGAFMVNAVESDYYNSAKHEIRVARAADHTPNLEQASSELGSEGEEPAPSNPGARPRSDWAGKFFVKGEDNPSASEVALGQSRRGLLLIALLLLPYFSRLAGLRYSTWISRYVLVSVALLFCPLTAHLFAYRFLTLFVWRVFWAWPLPLLIGLTIGAIVSGSLARPLLGRLTAGALMLAFAAMGPWTVAKHNWALANVGTYKVTSGYEVAKHVASSAASKGLSLTPEDVAINLCTLRNAPPSVGVRIFYLRNLLGRTMPQEIQARIGLLRYVEGEATRSITASEFLEQVQKRGITTILYVKDHPHAPAIAKRLKARNFRLSNHGEYVLAVKSPKTPR